MRQYLTVLASVPLGVLVGALLVSSSEGFTPNAIACVTPPTGMLGWWPGDVSSIDISGSGNHVQLQNGAEAGTPGKVIGAFAFDGVDDIAETSVVLSTTGTLDLWLKPSSLDTLHGIVGTFGNSSGSDRLWITLSGSNGGPGVGPNRLVVNLGDCCVNDIDIPNPIPLEQWTHIALTFDYIADSYTLFVNGQSITPTTVTRNAPTRALSFGGLRSTFGQSFYVDGLIDEVEVFDRVLSDEEIRAIYDAGDAGKCKSAAYIYVPLILREYSAGSQ